MTAIWEAIQSFGSIQWVAFILNVIYVVLAARQNIWCWLFGLAGVSVLFVIYLDARLYSDALLQVFYMLMSVYGWWSWRSRPGGELDIKNIAKARHFLYILLGAAGTLLLGFLFSLLGGAVPYVDAFTSAFAVVATYMVARQEIENWLYWIVIDLVCVGVYIDRQLHLIAFLFLIYTVLAVVGFRLWQRSLALKNET